jgi:hypothetical protein
MLSLLRRYHTVGIGKLLRVAELQGFGSIFEGREFTTFDRSQNVILARRDTNFELT